MFQFCTIMSIYNNAVKVFDDVVVSLLSETQVKQFESFVEQTDKLKLYGEMEVAA